ncbi:MAG: hypothetical protein RLZZ241_364, partial [Bacteroidota bacterium]
VTLLGDTATYTPDANYHGADSFTFTVSDGALTSSAATVSITVTPVADLEDDAALTYELEWVEIDVLANDNDVPEQGTLTVAQAQNGLVEILDNDTPNNPSDDRIVYTPNSGFTGEDIFTYTLCDISGHCESASVVITVLPIPKSYNDYTFTKEAIPVEIDVLENDIAVPSVGILDVGEVVHGTVSVNTNGTLEDPSDDTIIYVPESGFTGEEKFTYELCDDLGHCSTATVSVTVISGDTGGSVDDRVIVFELITPNQDGRNDFLFIQNVDKTTNNSLQIFNRWGVSVYEGKNYNNQNRVFDGRSRNKTSINASNYLPSGVYFYVFEYEMNQQKNVIRGYLYLGAN